MSTLVIDQRGTQLSYQGGALMIRIPGEQPQSVPLHLLERLITVGRVTLDGNLLARLAEQGVGLVAMPGRSTRGQAFLWSQGHGDAARRLGQYGLVSQPASCLFWARRFVMLRMIGARRLLRHAGQQRPELGRAMNKGLQHLDQALMQTRHSQDLDQLRGLEGAAAAAYFAAYAQLLPPALAFQGRNRRPPRDPVNAALSLSYTLAHSDAIRALARAGLDPMLGFLHEPAHGRESLACDLVELARPRLERWVWRLFADEKLTARHFSHTGQACRMNKAARRIFFAGYERQAGCHRRWFDRYARLLARACSRVGSSSTIEAA